MPPRTHSKLFEHRRASYGEPRSSSGEGRTQRVEVVECSSSTDDGGTVTPRTLNGIPAKIYCSTSTCTLLIVDGRDKGGRPGAFQSYPPLLLIGVDDMSNQER